MLHMREEAAAGVMPDGRTTSGSDLQVETLKSQEKLLKAKVTGFDLNIIHMKGKFLF